MAQYELPDSKREGGAYAYEAITVSTTAIGITATVVDPGEATNASEGPAGTAFLTVETNSIRFTLDGTTPEAAVGHLLAAGDSLIIRGLQNIRNLRMIRATADASVKVTVFR